jgi:hypothetical protein
MIFCDRIPGIRKVHYAWTCAGVNVAAIDAIPRRWRPRRMQASAASCGCVRRNGERRPRVTGIGCRDRDALFPTRHAVASGRRPTESRSTPASSACARSADRRRRHGADRSGEQGPHRLGNALLAVSNGVRASSVWSNRPDRLLALSRLPWGSVVGPIRCMASDCSGQTAGTCRQAISAWPACRAAQCMRERSIACPTARVRGFANQPPGGD